MKLRKDPFSAAEVYNAGPGEGGCFPVYVCLYNSTFSMNGVFALVLKGSVCFPSLQMPSAGCTTWLLTKAMTDAGTGHQGIQGAEKLEFPTKQPLSIRISALGT